MNESITIMVRQACPELVGALTTNGINPDPFDLSLSKDFAPRFPALESREP